MSSVSVAPAQSPLDIEQVRDLRRSVLCGELNWPREFVDDPADSGASLFLASLGAKPVGSARLSIHDGAGQAELLAVLPRFRRQGIGRLLLEALEAEARKRSLSCLRSLAVGDSRAFFEACGYQAAKDATKATLEKWLA